MLKIDKCLALCFKQEEKEETGFFSNSVATSAISLSVNMEVNGYTKEEIEPGGSTAARGSNLKLGGSTAAGGSNPRLGGCETCNEIRMEETGRV